MRQIEILGEIVQKVESLDLSQTISRRRLGINTAKGIIGAGLMLTTSRPKVVDAAPSTVWSSSDYGRYFNAPSDQQRFLERAKDIQNPVRRERLIQAAYRLQVAPRPHDIGGPLHLHDLIHGSARSRDFMENLAYEVLEWRIEENDFVAIETDGNCQGLANAETLEEPPKREPTSYSVFGDMGEFNDLYLTYQKRAVLSAVAHSADIPVFYGVQNSSDPERVRVFNELINSLRDNPGKRASGDAPLGNNGFWGRSIVRVVGDIVEATDFNDYGATKTFHLSQLNSVWIPVPLGVLGEINPRLLNTTQEAVDVTRRFKNTELDPEIIKWLLQV